MTEVLRVLWHDGRQVGTLARVRGALHFAYEGDWISTGHNLSPLSLPFATPIFVGPKVEGLPGLLNDCLPDAWGRRLARRELQVLGLDDSSAFNLLAWRGSRGLGALDFVPELAVARGPGVLAKVTAAALARGARQIERGLPTKVLSQLAQGGTGGGAWPKALVLEYDDGTLRVGPLDDVGQPSILKFDFSATGTKARTEYLFNLMAEKAGVTTAPCGLIEGGVGKSAHFISRRFDVVPGRMEGRVHFHSLAGLLHKESNALDYADFFRVGVRLGLGVDGLEQIARRMVFNLLASNQDDHGKNHAFGYDELTAKWHLTPAFDLTFTEGYLDRGMTIGHEVWPKFSRVAEMAANVGLTAEKMRQIYDECLEALSSWPKLARKFRLPSEHTGLVSDRFARLAEVCRPPP
jgi:serine/threonine-protein kinase HipA